MAKYFPVSPQFWTDRTVRSWDDSTRSLALYLLTSPHRNLEGLFRLPLTYMADDLMWPVAKVRKALARLRKDGFLQHDPEADVVFLCNALKYQAPKSAKQVKGALTVLAEVPTSSCHPAFIEACDTHAPALAKALAMGIDTHSDGIPPDEDES